MRASLFRFAFNREDVVGGGAKAELSSCFDRLSMRGETEPVCADPRALIPSLSKDEDCCMAPRRLLRIGAHKVEWAP